MDIPREWTFERSDIASGFDQHVREQLPFYDLATGAISHIARHYIPRGGLVYDIGAATGNVGRALSATLDERGAYFVPIEASAEMAALYDGPGREDLIVADARSVTYREFDLAVIFLTLMFIPVAARRAFLEMLRAKMRPGGAIVLFEKMERVAGYPGTVFCRLTLAGKAAAGVDPKDIVAKELSLGGVQRPLSAHEIPASAVQWMQFGEFSGYLIEAVV